MTNKRFKTLLISISGTWMALFMCLPLLLIFFAAFLKRGQESYLTAHISLNSFFQALHFIYLRIFFHSICWALVTTVICFLIAYPFAYFIVRVPKRIRLLLLFSIIIPFWTSSLIRTYAIMTIIKAKGLLNHFLLASHIIHTPLHILYTPIAVEIGLVYSLLPFMILPIYTNLEKLDWRLLEAANDLGASPWRTFYKIVLPLSAPGIISGVLLIFLPAMTLFYIPDVLGGAKSFLLGNLIKFQFINASNWPLGAMFSVFLVLMLLLLVYILRKLDVSRVEKVS